MNHESPISEEEFEEKMSEFFNAIEHVHWNRYFTLDNVPECLINFLKFHEMPALEQLRKQTSKPRLFATYEGKRVELTMASRLGDIGICHFLNEGEHGYHERVPIDSLSEFSTNPYESSSKTIYIKFR